ncbi:MULTISPECIES: hypothetical protein [unclassified Nocardiopsis]|uniref:hypothetical protein n=1 Tax=Nocardiopsis TaxID=2013 RepID=UPI00387B76E8
MAPLPQDRPRPVHRPRPDPPPPGGPDPRAGRPWPLHRTGTAALLAGAFLVSAAHPLGFVIGSAPVALIAGGGLGRTWYHLFRGEPGTPVREDRLTTAMALSVALVTLPPLFAASLAVVAIVDTYPYYLESTLVVAAMFTAVNLGLIGLTRLIGRALHRMASRVLVVDPDRPPAGRHVHDHLLPYDLGIVSGMWDPAAEPEADRYMRVQRTVDRIAAAVDELEPCTDLDGILADARQTRWETARDLYRIRGIRMKNQRVLDEHGPPPPPARRTLLGALLHRATLGAPAGASSTAAAGLRSAARALEIVDSRIDALADAAARVEEPLVRRAERRQLLDIADRHEHYIELALTSENTTLPASALGFDRLEAEAAFAVRVRLAREALARARRLTADTGLGADDDADLGEAGAGGAAGTGRDGVGAAGSAGADAATGKGGCPQAAEDP